MNKPLRLFDLLEYRKQTKPDRAVLVAKQGGEWKKIFIDEYIDNVNAISYGFMHLGVQRGDNIALISADRPEWNYTDLGVQQIGAVLVPIYPTISEDDYRYILKDCEVKYLVLENENMLRKVKNVLPELETLKGIYMIDKKEETEYPTLAELMQQGRDNAQPEQLAQLKASIGPRDLATMIYTSGTTGFPKGVMLCHEGILANLYGVQHTPKAHFTRAMSFLPLCHIYERMMNYMYQYLGMEIFYAESVAKVADNAQEVNPHMMAAVPRFIEKMYDKVYRKGEKLTGLRKRIFDWAINLGFDYELCDSRRSCLYNLKHAVADRLVYREIRKALGNNFRMIVSGGASIQPRLTRFFSAVGLDLYEGYGLTECSPLVAVTNTYAPEGRRVGSGGFVLPGIEVRFDPDTHEILCRGKNLMKGYYKAPDLTAQAIDSEGWFHTGDTGYLDAQGYMFLTGRTKNMFKTSMGKFVNPEVIEEKFKESPFILDMMVVGEGEKFAAAIIAPDFDMLHDWCQRHGITAQSREAMVADKAILARYQRVMDKYNATLGSHEQIKRFCLVTDTWSTDNQLLTPTLKIKRANLASLYQQQIAQLFA